MCQSFTLIGSYVNRKYSVPFFMIKADVCPCYIVPWVIYAGNLWKDIYHSLGERLRLAANHYHNCDISFNIFFTFISNYSNLLNDLILREQNHGQTLIPTIFFLYLFKYFLYNEFSFRSRILSRVLRLGYKLPKLSDMNFVTSNESKFPCESKTSFKCFFFLSLIYIYFQHQIHKSKLLAMIWFLLVGE